MQRGSRVRKCLTFILSYILKRMENFETLKAEGKKLVEKRLRMLLKWKKT